MFQTQWGGIESSEFGYFSSPSCIYNDIEEEIFYVGDQSSLQLFLPNGECLQRIGEKNSGEAMNEFDGVYGICKINNQLCVCDNGNDRIQIFNLIMNSNG